MRALIVKTSSLGDLIHTLPAVTDAVTAFPQLRFDWVAEEAFAEIPRWHRGVDRVIPVAIRRWRKRPFAQASRREMAAALAHLRAREYDTVIDAQGLLKSAILTRLSRGPRWGMDGGSCREPLAALAYQHRVTVARGRHAIDRVRELFSRVLGHSYDGDRLDYGLDPSTFPPPDEKHPYVVFLHGTSWPTKLWPVADWTALAQRAAATGYRILLPWGDDAEKRRAEVIASGCGGAKVLPRMGLCELAGILARAEGVAGVDTGLAHLAAALGVPGATLYLATSPSLTGARGMRQVCLEAAVDRVDADSVWAHLRRQMAREEL